MDSRNGLNPGGDPGDYIHALVALQRWTAALDWSGLDRLQAWKDAGKQRHVDCMLLSGNANTEALRVIAEAVL